MGKVNFSFSVSIYSPLTFILINNLKKKNIPDNYYCIPILCQMCKKSSNIEIISDYFRGGSERLCLIQAY